MPSCGGPSGAPILFVYDLPTSYRVRGRHATSADGVNFSFAGYLSNLPLTNGLSRITPHHHCCSECQCQFVLAQSGCTTFAFAVFIFSAAHHRKTAALKFAAAESMIAAAAANFEAAEKSISAACKTGAAKIINPLPPQIVKRQRQNVSPHTDLRRQ